MEIKFNQEMVKQAEDEYTKLHLSGQQKTMIDSFAHIFTQHLNISERAMRGFIFRVTREYQMDHHVILDNNFTKIGTAKRLEFAGQMAELLTKSLTRVLIDQDQKPLLDEAVDNVIQFYKEQISK